MQKTDKHFIITFRDEDHPGNDKRVTLRVSSIGESYLGPSFVKLSGFIFHTNQMVMEMSDKVARSRYKNTEAIHILSTDIIKVEEVGGQRILKKVS